MSAALFHVRNLSLAFGKDPIYSDFSVTLPDVGLTGIIGPNGCGKSTLLRCLGGGIMPQRGTVLLRETNIADMNATARARRLAFLTQEPPHLVDMTIEGLVAKGRTPWRRAFFPPSEADRAAVTRAVEAAALTDLRSRPLAALSGGQRQRAWIAMALAQETEVILLDEPTSYLDLPHQIRLMHLLRNLADQEGRRIVVVLHDLTLAARFCDHLLALSGGTSVTEGPPDIAITPEAVFRLYGLEAEVHPDPVFGHPVVHPKQ